MIVCKRCLAKRHGDCMFIVLTDGQTEPCGCACTPAAIARLAAVGEA